MRIRTADPHAASVMLYQLSYNPKVEQYEQKKVFLSRAKGKKAMPFFQFQPIQLKHLRKDDRFGLF